MVESFSLIVAIGCVLFAAVAAWATIKGLSL